MPKKIKAEELDEVIENLSNVQGMADDIDPKVSPLTAEAMGHADAGLSISLGVSVMPFYMATLSPEPALQNLIKDYINDTSGEMIGCWAITEPQHGSDAILGVDPKYDDLVRETIARGLVSKGKATAS